MHAFATLILMGVTSVAAEPKCPPDPNWSYEGPHGVTHWGERWPTCGQGKAQSPIDIPTDIQPQRGPVVEFHYRPFDLVVENTSHVIEVPAAKGGFITLDGHRYELEQFHFHTPSEHRIAGKAFPFEIHLVHRAADGKVAVVGILGEEGAAANPALQPVVAALPVASCEHRAQGARFDASTLLPAKRDYATYSGSLTTPGCTEGLTWLVLYDPISASSAQREKLGPFGVNARPVQPRNGRAVVRVHAGP